MDRAVHAAIHRDEAVKRVIRMQLHIEEACVIVVARDYAIAQILRIESKDISAHFIGDGIA